MFTKVYLENEQTEIFIIGKVNKNFFSIYHLRDYNERAITGCFYLDEINKAIKVTINVEIANKKIKNEPSVLNNIVNNNKNSSKEL